MTGLAWTIAGIAAIAGLGIGFIIARLGVWVRLGLIENAFRQLGGSFFEYKLLSREETFDAQWVIDEVDRTIRDAFENDSVIYEFNPFIKRDSDVYENSGPKG